MPGSDSRDASPALPGGTDRSRTSGGGLGESEDDIASSVERSQRKVAIPVASMLRLPVFRKLAC